jgi:hypothetical protein
MQFSSLFGSNIHLNTLLSNTLFHFNSIFYKALVFLILKIIETPFATVIAL